MDQRDKHWIPIEPRENLGETREGEGARAGDLFKDLSSTDRVSPIRPDAEGTEFTWNHESQSAVLPYPVVGIGWSTESVEELQELLRSLPEESGMAFVLIAHFGADGPSTLAELVSKCTRMPVYETEEGCEPQPNHVYVLTAEHIGRLERGRFHLEPRQYGEHSYLPIDAFFRTLGQEQKNYAMGVALCGANSDGALGLLAIGGEGGITIAQSREAGGGVAIPSACVELGRVDFVGSPAEIGIEISRLGSRLSVSRSLEQDCRTQADEESLQRIMKTLRSATGLDLHHYDLQMVLRRIARRMVIRRLDSLADYARFLEVRPDELKTLQEDALIKVTRFFRDSDFWHVFSTQLLPVFFQNGTPDKPVRIWCAGCSTGEEVYSAAVTVLEHMAVNGLSGAVQIFGTDASEAAIGRARAGIYPDSIVGDVTPERLRKYFVKANRGYQVSKEVRDCCIFAHQNLAGDPPFSHIDLLFCRNVLIYFSPLIQRQLIQSFHNSLERHGFLLLGMSESLQESDAWFRTFDRKARIYSRIGGDAIRGHDLSNVEATNLIPSSKFRARERGADSREGWSDLELQRAADRMLLARFAPPGLVIDEQMKVLQARGRSTPYLELAPGTVSWKLAAVLRHEIAAEVLGATEQVIAENIPGAVTCALNGDRGQRVQVQVEIMPITGSGTKPRRFLILFFDSEVPRPSATDPLAPGLPDGAEPSKMLGQLQQHLASTRYHLQSMIEDRDARNQELLAANEEIQSANEELQSMNEELETAKEELQSANEELLTVNEEMLQRNASLVQAGNDLTNLLNSVNVPLLILTEHLTIRQFTPPMERLLNIRAADVGRFIGEIRLQLSIEDVQPLLREVLDTLVTRELEVQDRDGRWHLLRVRPYRTADNKIDGLVFVLLDIDQLRRSEHELRSSREFARSVIHGVPVPVAILEADFTIRAANRAFHELTSSRQRELEGLSLPALVGQLWGLDSLEQKLSDLLSSAPGTLFGFEYQSTTQQAKTLWISGQLLPVEYRPVLLLTFDDITSRREAELIYSRQHEALRNEVELKSRSLLRAQEQLRDLASHLLIVQEEERQRVARELHDDISQRLSLLDMQCAQAEAGNAEQMLAIRSVVQSLNSDVRSISHRLHPAILKDLGLSAALRAIVQEFRRREGMPATYSESNLPDGLSQTVTTALYRITQEALRNISKHAGETHVKVSLAGSADKIRLQVRDFGTGFDQESDYPIRGLGLVSMEERARVAGGTFSVKSSLGDGTTVIVEIPVDHCGRRDD